MFLFKNGFAAIRQKWPEKRVHVRAIQHNDPVHVRLEDPVVISEGTKHRWSIAVENQAANPPDYNILDLWFFRAV